MGLLIGVCAIVVLLVGGVSVWLLAPTMRALRRPDFQPTPADDVSVLRAQQSGMVNGGD